MEKTGHDWLAKLPAHIQKQIKNNLYNTNDGLDILDDEVGDLRSFINNVFTWTDSNEGSDYWLTIHEKIKGDMMDFKTVYERFPEFSKTDEIINEYQIY